MKIKVTVRLTEKMLGMTPTNPELYREYIASKGAQEEEEVDALPSVEEQIEKATCVFPRDDKANPILWDYQIKGSFKDACSALRRCDDTQSKKLKAYKKLIDGTIFVFPRKVPIYLPEGQEISYCERPLRASSPQGEIVSLMRSETVPAGSWMQYTVRLLSKNLLSVLEEWLEYGELRGLGQWRNAGFGTFTYELEKMEEKKADD